ncbi:proline-rich receptor-like protein kinase PERK9 [Iris pallida]|uniref:Proline-rich receptor-like protein kinase PERK9 n=1 Tax=Iris pallida TaxID=29817 RepID=A0AAX6EJS7_IRIPA|nr:proline-rich receptor-like protein kinase PERK9 [Iris pallida]
MRLAVGHLRGGAVLWHRWAQMSGGKSRPLAATGTHGGVAGGAQPRSRRSSAVVLATGLPIRSSGGGR